jgi:SPP1 gp7 family putative phage head morphogenesis protein
MAQSQQKLTTKSIAQTEKQLINYYTKSMKSVIDEFENTYLKLLATVEAGVDPTPADLYKLDSYWKMMGELRAELTKLGEKEIALLNKEFIQQYINIYDGVAIPSQGAYTRIDTATAQQMINNVWCADGKDWRNRAWTNKEKLQEMLNEELINCVVAGKSPRELRTKIRERFGVSFSAADAVVRTEMAHIQTQAAKQRYQDSGIEMVQVWADKDERRCEVCGKLHQKKYLISEPVPVPAHPRCRCCIVPVI